MGTVERRQSRQKLSVYKLVIAIVAVFAYILFLTILIVVMIVVSSLCALSGRKKISAENHSQG